MALTGQEREAVQALLGEVDDLEGTEPWTRSAARAIRSIIRFAHRERRVPAQATAEVLRVPKAWSRRTRPATDVVALASRGRAYSSHHSLIARSGGRQVLEGVVVVGATLAAWAARSRSSMADLAERHVR